MLDIADSLAACNVASLPAAGWPEGDAMIAMMVAPWPGEANVWVEMLPKALHKAAQDARANVAGLPMGGG